ncbi:hypothetical protein SI65_09630 [Aspergillus cristatus]|uniref:Metallo-beta-lactamase domain-containing protein n=1 Tax=Aspergillus cristatus TaxID=573508 RepID=A0A1E3B1T9_ASPCR|nr:hypothetical protein SI65_09630 [Aspergillus cristatus]
MSSSTAAVLYALTVTTSPTSPGPEDATKKSHHLQEGFKNPWDSWYQHDFFGILGHMVHTGSKTRVPLLSRNIESTSNMARPCMLLRRIPQRLRVLFDPVFEDRCSPCSFMGPKRYTKMPCEIKDIPVIDAVVISHNHYDHLSYPTVKEIFERHPNCHFFAPLGNKAWFSSCGINNMTELDWWDERDIILSPSQGPAPATGVETPDGASEAKNADIKARIGCLPCQRRKVYFAGDTGYRAVPELPDDVDDHAPEYNFPACPAFKQIGQYRGPFDLDLIPISAYQPRYIMSPMHADPHDSVQIFKDTKCQRALGMHWGTWVLTEEDVLEPPRKLREYLRKEDIAEEGVFDICDIGESREF